MKSTYIFFASLLCSSHAVLGRAAKTLPMGNCSISTPAAMGTSISGNGDDAIQPIGNVNAPAATEGAGAQNEGAGQSTTDQQTRQPMSLTLNLLSLQRRVATARREPINPSSDTDESWQSPQPLECPYSHYQEIVHGAALKPHDQDAPQDIAYVALSSEMLPYHSMQIATYNSFNGPSAPGSYSLDGVNYKDCGLCLTIELGCRNPQEPCERTFYADAGAVDITELNGTQFAGTFRNVVFKEVNINAETFESTPVVNGQTWCFGNYTFDVVLDGGMDANQSGGDSPVMGNDTGAQRRR